MIDYSPLWKTLAKKNITTYALEHKFGFNKNMIHRLKHNQSITMNTLDYLCKTFDCDVTDIIKYVKEWKKQPLIISRLLLFFYVNGISSWNISFIIRLASSSAKHSLTVPLLHTIVVGVGSSSLNIGKVVSTFNLSAPLGSLLFFL